MSTYYGYFGEREKYNLGWWQYRWLAPIVKESNQSLTAHEATGSWTGSYYTSNKATLTLPANEYPVSVQFSDYGYYGTYGQGWYNSEDGYAMETGDTGTIDLYLCYADGQNYSGAKKFASISIVCPQSARPTTVYPITGGEALMGKALQIYATGPRGIWFSGECKVTIITAANYTKCGAPSNVAASNPVNKKITISWSAGSGGTNNAFDHYQVQYRDKTETGSYGAWKDLANVTGTSTTASPNATNKGYRQFRVRTVGKAGETWASSYVTSGEIQTNATAPTFTMTVSPVKINTSVSDGVYIKGLVKIKTTITNASASAPKTISSYSIKVEGYGSSTGTSYTTDAISTSGSIKVTCVVTDNNGYSTTKTQTVTVRDYKAPSGEIKFQRCKNSSGTVDVMGEYIKYYLAPTYTAVDGNSIKSAKLKIGSTTYTLTGDKTWRMLSTTYRQPIAQAVTATLTITDKFQTGTYSVVIPSANYAIYLNNNGTSIAFGGATQHNNAVEIATGRTLYIGDKT